MQPNYQIPAETISVETEVRKSKFICHLSHADSDVLAKQFIADIKSNYSDATHNCWAFQAEAPSSTRTIGCSDDGEPHGSAGKPMLNVLCHAKIGEVVAVVTRYYGGTKLGTGGLARAYSDSVKLALEKIKTNKKITWQQGIINLEYSLQSKVEKALLEFSAEIMSAKFEDKVILSIRFDKNNLGSLNEKLSNLTKGQLKVCLSNDLK